MVKPDLSPLERRAVEFSWPHQAHMPQRYNDNFKRYLENGGIVVPEQFVRGFAPAGFTGDASRFFAFCLAFDQIMKEGLAGDVAELGVYKGHTASLLAQFARAAQRTLFLLDTFDGFDARDLSNIDAGKSMEFADTSLEEVRSFVGTDRTRYIQGFFPDTADQLPPDGSYCLVHLDCDLYAPTYAALAYFYPRLVPGGYIIVHDYGSLRWDGLEKAIEEFFADKPEFPIMLPDSCGSAVVRKSAR